MKDNKLTGITLKNFNDMQNGGKEYLKNCPYSADEERYNELYSKGFVSKGKRLVNKKIKED